MAMSELRMRIVLPLGRNVARNGEPDRVNAARFTGVRRADDGTDAGRARKQTGGSSVGAAASFFGSI
jgi:hypothetical protein